MTDPLKKREDRAKPNAVIDKSVFQRIAERTSKERSRIWTVLHARYNLAIPFVLVEEVLVNRGGPRLIGAGLAEKMFRELMKQRNIWVDDEIGAVFDELVEKNRRTTFKPVPDAFKKRVARFAPTLGAYQDFLKQREKEAEEELRWRMTEQNRLAESRSEQHFSGEKWFQDEQGRFFCLVSNQKEFFNRFVSPEFHSRDRTSNRWFEVLDRSLGLHMRRRFPDRAADIERALRSISMQVLFRNPVSHSIVLAKSFYFWAPVVRIGSHVRSAKIIIKRGDQAGNIHDERYLAAGLMADVILTRDKQMASMADAFKGSGFWRGAVDAVLDVIPESQVLGKMRRGTKMRTGT